jgi:hypothetical protein
MEQVVLQGAQVTSQLLAGLGDGGAEGRRGSVDALAGGIVAARDQFEPSGPAI